MDGGAWQATVQGVAKNRTQLSHFTSQIYNKSSWWFKKFYPFKKVFAQLQDSGSELTEEMKVFFLTHSTSCLYESASLVVKRTTGAISNIKGLNIENLCFRKITGRAGRAGHSLGPQGFLDSVWLVSGVGTRPNVPMPASPQQTLAPSSHVLPLLPATCVPDLNPGIPQKTPPSPLLATNNSSRKTSISQLSLTSQVLESK